MRTLLSYPRGEVYIPLASWTIQYLHKFIIGVVCQTNNRLNENYHYQMVIPFAIIMDDRGFYQRVKRTKLLPFRQPRHQLPIHKPMQTTFKNCSSAKKVVMNRSIGK